MKKKNVIKEVDSIVVPDTESKPITGLGDVIAAATSAIGIKPCDECKKRQEKLNKFFPFLKGAKRHLTDDEINLILTANKTKTIANTSEFILLYNSVYGTNIKPCSSCGAMYRPLLDKLVTLVQYQKLNEDDSNIQE
jgi:hypothetical protein